MRTRAAHRKAAAAHVEAEARMSRHAPFSTDWEAAAQDLEAAQAVLGGGKLTARQIARLLRDARKRA